MSQKDMQHDRQRARDAARLQEHFERTENKPMMCPVCKEEIKKTEKVVLNLKREYIHVRCSSKPRS